MRHRRRHLLLALGAASVLALSGCATPAGSGAPSSAADAPPGASLGSLSPAPPEGEVIAQGTVMDVAGTVELCLGPIMESYPPQCSGIPVTNWTWDGVDGSETSGDVTWGAYAVQGTYDGDAFSVTQPPIMLALYDPMMIEDPTGGEPGAGDEGTLLAIQEELPDSLGDAYLGSYPDNGWLRVDVVWDDGTWQDAADDDYGDDVVIITPALRPIEG
ncbi:hypothetical protein ASD56_09190 [Microbacterium sp. Root166]|uniref:hypothetical protein n=1 Tax=Microbacterium sp. Root166 TaxID=1736478 RepID=UPI0006FF9204|nr:hypothetical protein [Microbacterium sp. Root166]KQZ84175.1 hypothetical protein ASD56_09190 [Microbacterium sp. Root166]